jgi:hypothetical protein
MTIGVRAFLVGLLDRRWRLPQGGRRPSRLHLRLVHLDVYGDLFEGHDRELRYRLDAMFADASEGQVLALDRTASGTR